MVATLPSELCVHIDSDDNGQLKLGGIELFLVKDFAYYTGFTYDIIQPADGSWGRQLPNGTFIGLIGHVQNYVADMIITCISAVSN